MNNANKEQKETFEDKLNYFRLNYCDADDEAEIEDLYELKQLHKEDIKDITNIKDSWELQCKIERDKVCKQYNQLEEKDKQINALNLQLKNKSCECVIVEDNGIFTAGYFDISNSIKTIMQEKDKQILSLKIDYDTILENRDNQIKELQAHIKNYCKCSLCYHNAVIEFNKRT